MPRVRVPDQCIGVDIPGGKSYASRHGLIDMDAADVARLPGSSVGEMGLLITGQAFRDPRGRDCEKCGFGLFGYMKQCPRCTGAKS